jgi:hypothetical protein
MGNEADEFQNISAIGLEIDGIFRAGPALWSCLLASRGHKLAR